MDSQQTEIDRIGRMWGIGSPLSIFPEEIRPYDPEQIEGVIDHFSILCTMIHDPSQAAALILEEFNQKKGIDTDDPIYIDRTDIEAVIRRHIPACLETAWGIHDPKYAFDQSILPQDDNGFQWAAH